MMAKNCLSSFMMMESWAVLKAHLVIIHQLKVVEAPNSYEYTLSFVKVFSKDKEAALVINL